jgi:DNA-binding MarR family transcriptional regulator
MKPEKNGLAADISSKKTEVLSQIFDDLRRVFQVIHEYSRRVERATGLTGPQVWAIRVISEDQPIKISSLARRMYLHVATVVGIVDRLEARKLVRRVRSDKDRRVVHVELTAQGRELVQNAPQVAQWMLIEGLEDLPDRKLKTIQSGMAMMVKILNAHHLPPQLLMSQEINETKMLPDGARRVESGQRL